MTLEKFSPDTFEHLVRALAVSTIGPGTTAFGNGPDGGREATFSGKIPYPFPPTEEWNGYGIIQAKFKEKTETTAKDNAWALKQLEDELEKWSSQKRDKPPKYYIFSTNVDLTSAKGGGKDQLSEAFETAKSTIGLEGYSIWDANQIITYIDSYESIRRRFFDLLTPGDVLAELTKFLNAAVETESILTSYLTRGLIADEDARLSQAGDRTEDRIILSDVFLELPTGEMEVRENNGDLNNPDSSRQGAIDILSSVASGKLDSLSIAHFAENDETIGFYPYTQWCNRFVFLGGPGSGKSTIGQFFSQIHRAAILEQRPPQKLEYKIKEIIRKHKIRCTEDNIPWPIRPRYPFRVELNAFARALAESGNTNRISLISYLRSQVGGEHHLTQNLFREVLSIHPILLILDGLDEVPWSSNRKEVIASIQEFLAEAADVEADLLVVASSRPDGYSGEFQNGNVLQLFLQPLNKPEALRCAERYLHAKNKFKNDTRTSETLEVLRQSVEHPVVSNLMQSPLQVTFMVTVVSASGKPSESRWQLFTDYYRTIYERELQKAVRPFNEVLSQRRQDIDTLHHYVGFLLQSRGEGAGGTQAEISRAEFEKLVTDLLVENGLSGIELARQKELIVGAASTRLVFLTSKREEKLSFDVRSLQEYMAAAYLTNGDSDIIMSRLMTVGHSTYWRNTVIFSIGRFFADAQHRNHRDKARVLCDDLNRIDPGNFICKIGSRLALAIVRSATVGNAPLFTRHLAKSALELLDVPRLPEDKSIESLALIYKEELFEEYHEAVMLRIGSKEIEKTINTWILILILRNSGVAWAKLLTERSWPTIESEAAKILRAYVQSMDDSFELNAYINEKLLSLIFRISISETFDLIADLKVKIKSGDVDSKSDVIYCLSFLRAPHKKERIPISANGILSQLKLGIACMTSSNLKRCLRVICDSLRPMADTAHPDWLSCLAAEDFINSPTKDSFISAFTAISSNSDQDYRIAISKLIPWPLSASMPVMEYSVNTSPGDLLDTSFSFSDILERESVWIKNGIDIQELSQPFPKTRILPLLGVKSGECQHGGDDLAGLFPYLEKLCQSDLSSIRENAAWIFFFYIRQTRRFSQLDPTWLRKNVIPSRSRWLIHDLDREFLFSVADDDKWLDFINEFGMRVRSILAREWSDEYNVNPFVNQFCQNPTLTGLLRLSAVACAAGGFFSGQDWRRVNVAQAIENRLEFFLAILMLVNPEFMDSSGQDVVDLFEAGLDRFKENEIEYFFFLTYWVIDRNMRSIKNVKNIISRLLPLADSRCESVKIRFVDLLKRLLEETPSANIVNEASPD